MGTELIQLLEQEARVETDQALREAEAKAAEVVAAGAREAEEIEAAARRRVDSERAQARARATSTASLRAAAVVLAAKDEAIRRVFEQAEAELRSAAANPVRRGAVLRALLREAAAGVAGGRATVEVARGDVEAVRDASRELGLDAEVREAADVADGVRVAAADGRVVVENTLASRLARARREMVSRVAEILWNR
ncbi:MAG TPA: V-type ATP synthase subunit E [bacterium]|nr:V-type ATP synthase subunit E [bacterium]